MKLLTHVYLANLIIDELKANNGRIWIPSEKGDYSTGTLREPFPGGNKGAPPMAVFPTRAEAKADADGDLNGDPKGEFYTVPDGVKKVILENPDFFRGGAAGCDALPDIMFSQFIIHPFESGIWLEYMFDGFKLLPKGKERDQVYSFLLGLMTHYAADMFGHAYVNEYTEGWFDSFYKTRAKKHMLVEEYMDDCLENPPSRQTVIPKDRRNIAVPTNFLASRFADKWNIEEQIKKIKPKKKSDEAMSEYQSLPLKPLRSLSFEFMQADEDRTNNDVLYPKDYNNKITQMENWIKIWKNITQEILSGEAAVISVPSGIMWLGDENAVKKIAEDMYGQKKTKEEIVQAMDDVFKEKGVYYRLIEDFKDFGVSKVYPYGGEREFKAFSLCLTASKFCIMGYKELNRYLGCDPDKPDVAAFKQDKSKHSMRSLLLTIDSATDLYDFFRGETTCCGFGISTKTRRTAYNAYFASDIVSNGKVYIDLPYPIPFEDITKFTLFVSCGITWHIRKIEIKDGSTGKVIAEKTGPISVEKFKDHTVNVEQQAMAEFIKSVGPAEDIDVPHRIMSWLYSLDGQDRDSESENPSRKPWEYTEYAIYRNLIEQNEQSKQESFVPGLQSNLLSSEFDDIPKELPEPKKPSVPSKSKTAVISDVTEAPEKALMDIVFEGKRVPLKKRVLPKQKKAKPAKGTEETRDKKPETDGDKKMSEAMGRGEHKPDMKQKDKSDMSKSTDRGHPEDPKKKDSKDDFKKKDDGGMEKAMDKDDETGSEKPSKTKNDGDMDKAADKGSPEDARKKDSKDDFKKKDDGGMEKAMDKDDSEKKDNDGMDEAMDKDDSDKPSKKKDNADMNKYMDKSDSKKKDSKDDFKKKDDDVMNKK